MRKHPGARLKAVVVAVALVVAALLVCRPWAPQASWAEAPDSAASDTSSTISLKLRNVPVLDVLKTLSDRGKLNLVVSPAVQGNVTLFLEDVGVMEALEMTADAASLAYVMDGGTIKVMTAQEYADKYGRPFKDLTVTRSFHLKYTNALTLNQNLQQFKSRLGQTAVDIRTNSVMVVDLPGAVRKMEAYVAQVDLPMETRTFALKYADADALVNVIRPLLSMQAKLEADGNNNKLIVSDIPSKVQEAELVISEYDTPPETVTRVYALNYVRPDTLAKVLQGRLTPGVGTARADLSTGKLFVTDVPERLAEVEEYIAHIDERTSEVVIESKIFQVSLSDEYKMGVDWEGVISKIGGRNIDDIMIKGSFRILSDTSPAGTITGGIGNDDYRAMLEALESVGETNLLSSPRITALNREEARILVGSTVPYITTETLEDASGRITRFEKVVEVDVGVKLNVTPEIHRDGYISMYIRPEVSSVTGFNQDIPVVETTQAETRVMVKDGSTIVIAGLIQDQIRETVERVPVLGRIPILGIPFRSTDKSVVKSELVIFLSPTIVAPDRTSEELEHYEKTHEDR